MKLNPLSKAPFISVLCLCSLLIKANVTIAQTTPKYQDAMVNGNPEGLEQHIMKVIEYPKEAREDGIQGFTLLKFKVDKTGKIDSIDILYASDNALTGESVRLIVSTKGKWQPAIRKGQPIDTWQYLPTLYILQGDEKTVMFVYDRKKALGDLYYKEGLKLYEAGQASQAMESFILAYLLNNENHAALQNTILILINEGDYDLACHRMNQLIDGKQFSKEFKNNIQNLMSSYCKD
jgi:TonB family protein